MDTEKICGIWGGYGKYMGEYGGGYGCICVDMWGYVVDMGVQCGDILLFRVPEDKCHMVLPEIEEEAEEDTKLSLTSLLLGE